MNRNHIRHAYNWTVIAAGLVVVTASAYALPYRQLNARFVVMAIVTVAIGSRISIKIPRVQAHISVSDTCVFLMLLLFGGEAAILVAAAEAFCTSLRIGTKARTHIFNSAVMAVSTFLSFMSLRLCFGVKWAQTGWYSSNYVTALCVMAVIQYLANSSMVAAGSALKTETPIWSTWRKNFLWTSITYVAGAWAAGLIAQLISYAGFVAFVATVPIVVIVYFTYWTYMKNVEASALQAEQARRHVEELNRHIAEQERMSKALQETQQHFRNAFDYAAIGMALVSTQGSWLRVNRSLCEILGYSEQELLKMNFQSITHADDVGNDLANLYRLIQGETLTSQVEKRYVHQSGQIVWAMNSVSLMRDAQDNPAHFIFQIQDISERKNAEATLQSLSLIDELTGLYNRRGFMAVTEQHLMSIHRDGKVPVVIYADLDGLKEINDSLGHLEGDRALVKTAEILKDTFRTSDIVARLGGDEFVVLAAIGADETGASVTTRLQEEFNARNRLQKRPYNLSVSIGTAVAEVDDWSSVETLMSRADKEMYTHKRQRRSRGVVIADFGKQKIEAVA